MLARPALLLVALLASGVSAQPAPAPETIVVPARTLVMLRMSWRVSSDRQERGDRFRFTIAEDVRVGDVVVMPAGSQGEGEVVHAAGSGGRNHPGELVLAARFVRVGAQNVPLRSFVAGSTDRASDSLAVPIFDRESGGGRGDDAHIGRDGLASARTAVEVRLPPAEAASEGMRAGLSSEAPAFAGDDSGFATIMFYRENAEGGSTRRQQIREGDTVLTDLPNGSYASVRLPVGAHRFGTRSSKDEDLWLELDSGETYYVACAMKSLALNCSPSNQRLFEFQRKSLRPLR